MSRYLLDIDPDASNYFQQMHTYLYNTRKRDLL
jgi:hypothetical protein